MTTQGGDDRFTTYHGLMPGDDIHVSKPGGARVLIVSERGGTEAGVVLDPTTALELAADLDGGSAVLLAAERSLIEEVPASRGRGDNLTHLRCDRYAPTHEGSNGHTMASRHHATLGYYGHRIKLPDGQQVTVYVNADGVISIDVGTNTAVRIRHGKSSQRVYNAQVAADGIFGGYTASTAASRDQVAAQAIPTVTAPPDAVRHHRAVVAESFAAPAMTRATPTAPLEGGEVADA